MKILMKVFHRLYMTLFLKPYKFFFKNKVKKVGKNFGVNGPFTVINPGKLTIGDNCSINHNAYINCYNPINIGNNVTISANVTIVSTGIDYKHWFKTNERRHIDGNGITIGDYVWLGTGATVLQGGNIIGHHVVVAANATVCNEISESYCVVAGTPAKIIKKLSPEEINNL